MFIVTSSQMREADRQAIEQYGIPSIVLMENAATGIVDVVHERFSDAQRVVILAGKGNNGGDGLAVARHLHNRGRMVEVWLFASLKEVRGDAAKNLRIARRMGVPIMTVKSRRDMIRLADALSRADLAIDALFGTGLTKPLNGMYAEAVALLSGSGVPVLAVDIPSGLSGSTQDLIGPAVQADMTVTFAALKVPHVFTPAVSFMGDVVVVDIGIPFEVLEGLATLELLGKDALSTLIESRPLESHKGSFGHVVVIAGSRDKPGAAALAARAAYRMGAGLVTVASVEPCVSSTIHGGSEIMGRVLMSTHEGTINPDSLPGLIEFCRDKDAVLIGPGMGTGEETQDFIRTLVMGLAHPVVLDADALTAFQGKLPRLRERSEMTILTPHPGEMARLLNVDVDRVQAERVATVQDAVRQSNAVTILKGHQSLIGVPGDRVYVNPTGNPGMATGGMGDILGGMITSLVGQGYTAEAAACLATFLHGIAGDLALESTGEISLMAGDLLDMIPRALKWLTEPS
ncbi:MAG TPA: NAD(P)H-hydrate dehydratase [Thermoanaerobaculia bacterium]|nr:NAD(P)H-hydrate dehydratase [Thermoanaerobaculia bacterium]HUM29663.1 NAD(P)H-hydrate dehydratase [Thermoanaerobaculia bacterium]HXK67314.1 NAD(P)H-hydrate dehydratase [Thermoanaerobaculia bacterium]